MTDIHVVQPEELGTDFEFNTTTKKWGIAPNVRVHISTDSGNILTSGTDDGVFLDENSLKKYKLIQDNANRKIKLYEYTGATFDQQTAVLISDIDMTLLEATLDDVSIANGSSVITFYDEATGESLSFDTSAPIFSILRANTNAIQLAGDGKNSALTATLIVDPSTNNILKIGVAGAMVDKNDILALLNNSTNTLTSSVNTLTSTVNGKTATATIINSNTIALDTTNNLLKTSINGVEATVTVAKLKNTAGTTIGYAITG